jgi:hypothetical protein
MRRIFITLTLFFIFASIAPANAQNALGAGFYDDTTPAIVFDGGTWSQVTDANAYMGSRKSTGFTTSITYKMTANIFGDGFVLYINKNTTGADANMCINAVCEVISFYAPSSTYATITVTGLGYGTHNVVITKMSTASTFMSIDALHVLPPAIPPTSIPIINVTVVFPTLVPTVTGTQYIWVGNFPEQTPETTPEHQESITIAGQESIINYEIRPSDVVIVVMLGFLVIIVGTSFIVRLWGLKND